MVRLSKHQKNGGNFSMDEEMVSKNDINAEIPCKNCGSSLVEEGYELALCQECRDLLSKRPIPVWIRVFFGIVTIILIFTLIKLPSSIRAGIAFERGVKADKSRKCVSAMNEYEKVIEVFPDSTLVLARLGIDYYRNEKIMECLIYLNKVRILAIMI